MINNTTVYFSKLKPNAIIPSKREEDAAYDLYACFDEDYITIKPHTSQLISTGIASAFDSQYGLIFYERGSTGIRNLKVNAGVIDSGFRNEIFVCLYNGNDYDIVIAKKDAIQNYPYLKTKNEFEHLYPYEKAIAQALLVPIPKVEVKEIPYDELKQIKSERGMGMLGSSSK